MEYVKVDDLKAVLSKIKKSRDNDMLVHPERKIIWQWAVNNFERKILESEKNLKQCDRQLEDSINEKKKHF